MPSPGTVKLVLPPRQSRGGLGIRGWGLGSPIRNGEMMTEEGRGPAPPLRLAGWAGLRYRDEKRKDSSMSARAFSSEAMTRSKS
jgi:hypothetical protein